MRVLLPLLLLFPCASIATSCAHAVIYICSHHAAVSEVARVDVRARTDGDYDLEIVHVDGPGSGDAYCSPPGYEIEEEATHVEMSGGDYALLAKAEDNAIPYAFPLRGQVVVEPNRCYVPAMTCAAGALPDALTCRLILKATSCASLSHSRRVVLGGMSGC